MQRCPLKSNTGLSAGSGSGGVAASACTTLKKANSRVTRLRATPTLFARSYFVFQCFVAVLSSLITFLPFLAEL